MIIKTHRSKRASLLFVFVLFLIFQTDTFAQKNNFKVQVYTKGKVSLGYERFFDNGISILANYKISDTDYRRPFALEEEYTTNKGQRAGIQSRYYFKIKESKVRNVYCGLKFEMGRHQFDLRRLSSVSRSSSRVGLFFDIFFPNTSFTTENKKYFTAKSNKIWVSSYGFNLGFQRTWKMISWDVGCNFDFNVLHSSDDSFTLLTGEKINFKEDISGFQPGVYFGLGIAF